MLLNVEEMSLIQVMNHKNREMVINDIKRSIPTIQDIELRAICEKTLSKLSAMSDTEFQKLYI